MNRLRIFGCLVVSLFSLCSSDAQDATDIGSRRELFLDRVLIESLDQAQLVLHHPVPKEIVLKHDEPWEGSGSGYHSIFEDGDKFRMYYKAWDLDVSQGKVAQPHPLYCCYAESADGIHWEKPKLGLHEFQGSKENNIVMATGKIGSLNADPGHPAVFLDGNPNAPADSRYKAIIRSSKPNALLAFGSPDGIHFSPLADRPIITFGAFDSQNLAFWDPNIGKYRAYFRFFNTGRRDILTATSDNFLDWTKPEPIAYRDSPPEQLYTNQIKPYDRAPHILIGFPTRYVERGWNPSMERLPDLEHRRLRSSASNRYGMALTEGLLMSSRDGKTFDRWNEAFLRPGIQRPGTWHYGQQYLGWHIIETKSADEGAPNELSLYATESYWTPPGSHVRRYTLRLDGFVSVNAPLSGGTLVTKPIRFTGDSLELNFSSSAAGGIRVGLETPDGNAIPSFGLDDCHEIFGDELARKVVWKNNPDLNALAGTPVRIRFELKDADLYAYHFVSK